MDKTKIEMTVPDTILPYLLRGTERKELQQNALLLYPYIKNETISHGKAAELLGISKWELIELYGTFGLPYFDMGIDELKADVENIEKILDKKI